MFEYFEIYFFPMSQDLFFWFKKCTNFVKLVCRVKKNLNGIFQFELLVSISAVTSKIFVNKMYLFL